MSVSTDGLPFILPPAVAAVALLAAGYPQAAIAIGLLTAGITAFFRDPDRSSDAPAGRVLSPADGRVVLVDRTERGELRIAIFLSLLNVHIARSPVAGVLRSSRRIPGPTRAAFRDDARENARVEMKIDTVHGPVGLALMAGLVARRVLPWVEAPTDLQRGQRIAIIRFGSRAEILLPAGFAPRVSVGEHVRAGETDIAEPLAAEQPVAPPMRDPIPPPHGP